MTHRRIPNQRLYYCSVVHKRNAPLTRRSGQWRGRRRARGLADPVSAVGVRTGPERARGPQPRRPAGAGAGLLRRLKNCPHHNNIFNPQ